VNWNTAMTAAAALASGNCGLSDGSGVGDWHLPSRLEFRGLVDINNSHPALPIGHPFINVLTGSTEWYWASTVFTTDPNVAWLMRMDFGNLRGDQKTEIYYVWLVR